ARCHAGTHERAYGRDGDDDGSYAEVVKRLDDVDVRETARTPAPGGRGKGRLTAPAGFPVFLGGLCRRPPLRFRNVVSPSFFPGPTIMIAGLAPSKLRAICATSSRVTALIRLSRRSM